MKFKQAFDEAKTWQRRVVLISFYHNAKRIKNKKWKLIDSASYFGVSIGQISESLSLASKYDDVKDCKSKNEALRRIKK